MSLSELLAAIKDGAEIGYFVSLETGRAIVEIDGQAVGVVDPPGF